MPLTPALSAYLDFLRFFAALAVLLGHLEQDGFALGGVPLAFLSHEAVIVFFLMSGYIIASSTLGRRDVGPIEYAVARLSRIYSVALPAVVFCVVLAWALGTWAPDLAARIPSYEPPSWSNTLLSLTFLNESWGIDSRVTLNGPYWSLPYEVWYYVIFGFWFFAKGAWRWPLTIGAGVLAGPAILVLFPIWILGAWLAFHPRRLPVPSKAVAVVVWLGSLGAVWLVSASGIEHHFKAILHNNVPGFWRLEASQRFLTDWLIGLLLAAHLWAWGGLPQWLHQSWQRRAGLWAAWAGFSFTLYLFHRPLTTMVAKALGPAVNSVPLTLLVVALSLLICWLIAFGTERQLPRWRRGIRRLLAAAWPQPAALRP